MAIEIPGIPRKFHGDVHVYLEEEEDLHDFGAGPDCPCRPRCDYHDKKTGKAVWIHRSREDWS